MQFFSIIFLLPFLVATFAAVAAAQRCYGGGNITANSTYARNRHLLLSNLSLTVAAASGGGGFFPSTAGENAADKIYGSVLCRGDASAEDCSACTNLSASLIARNCSDQKEAIEWGDKCTVRFSDRNIFGALETKPIQLVYRVDEISEDSAADFRGNLSDLTSELVQRASEGSKARKFATGETDFGGLQTIYSMVQCTPDLTESSCGGCLREAVRDFERCCGKHIGGVARKPSCQYRFEVYTFFDDSVGNAPPPPPPPAPPQSPPPPPAVNPTDEGPKGKKRSKSLTVLFIILPLTVFFALVGLAYARFQMKKTRRDPENEDRTMSEEDSLKYSLATIQAATDDFSVAKTLGRGGFGSVYKGKLSSGQYIAVKRLARWSPQGDVDFKNEIMLLARLHHKNLVKLIGFCLENDERLLIYEYVPNGSLDCIIQDVTKRRQLNWEQRQNIIYGIARGMLYLHEESNLRIIHHDLKAGNVLLDGEMNAKIADFGCARLFAVSQSKGNTEKIAGTYGYMPPEYVKQGRFSVKTDVFSFGVLILEIVTGKTNTSFHNSEQTENLLSYAWKNWRRGRIQDLMDGAMIKSGSESKIVRCIHIGLLCVQENEAKRPTMASVLFMLSDVSVTIPQPSRPAFLVLDSMEQGAAPLQQDNKLSGCSIPAAGFSEQVSLNEASISELYPR